MIHNLLHGGAGVIHFENVQDNQSIDWVWLVLLVDINDKAECGGAAVVLAFECIFCVATDNFHGKFCGIILRHTFQHRFQNDTLRPISDILFS